VAARIANRGAESRKPLVLLPDAKFSNQQNEKRAQTTVIERHS
jgi:hypothetical protein